MSGLATSYVSAVDEMFAKARDALAASASAVGIITPVIRYVGRDTETVPPVTKFGAEVAQVTATSRQTALGVARKRYTTTGTLYVRVFAPQAGANGYELGRKWSDGVRNAFRQTTNGASVWYRNARVQEQIAERGAYRFNVAIDYSYDELS